MSNLYRTNGKVEEFNPKSGKEFSLEELQTAVGGYIELIYLPESEVLVVNEEGMIQKLTFNKKASIIANRPIVGNVVKCKKSQIN
jgi:hypothetical protein